MLLQTLAASLLESGLTGKTVIRAVEDRIWAAQHF